MPRNRFEQVDEIQPDAITLILSGQGDDKFGRVYCPAEATEGQLANGIDSGIVPVADAVVGAIRLANELKLPIVVLDPENLWNPDWGDLYREDEDDGAPLPNGSAPHS